MAFEKKEFSRQAGNNLASLKHIGKEVKNGRVCLTERSYKNEEGEIITQKEFGLPILLEGDIYPTEIYFFPFVLNKDATNSSNYLNEKEFKINDEIYASRENVNRAIENFIIEKIEYAKQFLEIWQSNIWLSKNMWQKALYYSYLYVPYEGETFYQENQAGNFGTINGEVIPLYFIIDNNVKGYFYERELPDDIEDTLVAVEAAINQAFEFYLNDIIAYINFHNKGEKFYIFKKFKKDANIPNKYWLNTVTNYRDLILSLYLYCELDNNGQKIYYNLLKSEKGNHPLRPSYYGYKKKGLKSIEIFFKNKIGERTSRLQFCMKKTPFNLDCRGTDLEITRWGFNKQPSKTDLPFIISDPTLDKMPEFEPEIKVEPKVQNNLVENDDSFPF